MIAIISDKYPWFSYKFYLLYFNFSASNSNNFYFPITAVINRGLGGASGSKAQRYVVVPPEETATTSDNFGLNFLQNLHNSKGMPDGMVTFPDSFS